MSGYQLLENNYILPTPAGAYYAVSADSDDKARWFLLNLLSFQESKLLTEDHLLSIVKASCMSTVVYKLETHS